MTFFGLTHLGPRSALGHASASSAKVVSLRDITDAQLLTAFDAFDTLKEGSLARKQIRALLDFVYGRPPPESMRITPPPARALARSSLCRTSRLLCT
jgi:hypothetical protein